MQNLNSIKQLPLMQSSDIYKLLPKYNCGQCGFPSCSTFSRRVVILKDKIEKCIFLNEENLKKINELLKEEVENEKIKSTALIQPCTEEGHLTIEANLCSYSNFGNGFDSDILCLILENSDFDKCNCSSELGYAVLYKEIKRIHIFKNGNITIRKAKDDEDIFSTLNFLSSILLPAVITDCRSSFIECYFYCKCSCKSEFEKDKVKFNEFDDIIEILKKRNNLEKADEILRNILRRAIKLISEKKNSGLIYFALFLIFKNVLNVPLNEQYINFFIDSFNSLKNSDKDKAKEIKNKYNELIIKIKNPQILRILFSSYLITQLFEFTS